MEKYHRIPWHVEIDTKCIKALWICLTVWLVYTSLIPNSSYWLPTGWISTL